MTSRWSSGCYRWWDGMLLFILATGRQCQMAESVLLPSPVETLGYLFSLFWSSYAHRHRGHAVPHAGFIRVCRRDWRTAEGHSEGNEGITAELRVF